MAALSLRCLSLPRAFGLALALLGAVALPTAAVAAPNLGSDEDYIVRLNSAVSVSGPDVRVGDLFSGHPNHEEKVVAKSPAPGQRTVLSSDFLANLARSYGIDWQPNDQFDRAVIYRPGRTLAAADILAAVKSDLVGKGMPARIGLRPNGTIPTLVLPADAATPLLVREAFFDPITKGFSAVIEIAGSDSGSQFMQIRGIGAPTMAVPVLKEDAGRTDVISAAMLDEVEVPEEQIKRDTVTDASLLIGKTPRGLLRAGHPIRENEVGRTTLVDVPVLRGNVDRDGVISEADITWTTVNAAELTDDVVTKIDYLIGKTPRHMVVAGSPIRRGDVVAAQDVTMAVAARDLPQGTSLHPSDISWVAMKDSQVATGVIVDRSGLAGRATTRPLRSGEPVRTYDVTRPTVISKGKLVTIVYSTPVINLTVQGEAMENGGVQDTIRVANAKSRSTVLAEVIDGSTVRVVSQQSAMR